MNEGKKAVKAIAASTIKEIASQFGNFFWSYKVQNVLKISGKILWILCLVVFFAAAIVLMVAPKEAAITHVALIIVMIPCFLLLLAFLIGVILVISFLCDEFVS